MLFNSLEYFIFFSAVFIYQWYLHPLLFSGRENSRQILHSFLLGASYIFYMSWDWRFSGLIFLSTLIDYVLALKIDAEEDSAARLAWLRLSLFLNLIVILGFFKYYNFFASSSNSLLSLLGLGSPVPVIKNLILPVGISFFTFQSMSYTIDVYRRHIPCEKSFTRFALFVSFFPQLVAGPIVTGKTFLPQLYRDPVLENIEFRIALRFFFLGYIKKVVISDNISPIVDLVMRNPENFGTAASWLAMTLCVIQIYCDFSGYTDMAYGSALLLGYELPENFRMPFLGSTLTDFWRRWHISLSTWLRDYVYISLGGSRTGYIRHKLNLFLTMLLAGFWHGANWTFIIWGGTQGAILAGESVYQDLKKKYFPAENRYLKPLKFIFGIISTYTVFIFIGSFFRAESMSSALTVLGNMLSFSEKGLRPYMVKTGMAAAAAIAVGHFAGYWIFEKKKTFSVPAYIEFAAGAAAVLIISLMTNENSAPFVYFQF